MSEKHRRKKSGDGFWNIMTMLVLLVTLGVLTLQGTIFLNPYAAFNPFPPFEMPENIVLPTATETSALLPDIWTETPTETLLPSATIEVTPTTELVLQEGTPVVEETPLLPTETPFAGYYSFAAQVPPNLINSTIFKPDQGCNWLGVAGQVFDLQGRPVKGIRVWLRGSIDNKRVDFLGLTLDSSPYGPSGFEFTLADKPFNSTGKLSIQLLDQAGIPISNQIFFDTFDDCERNLILINFKQVR
ncbi:MAG: hypothetical protein CVU39_05080 [Chloroflexi bacterium HGW-Chloroflexi-10]|nr:MAG: hypothetical protein CVU39_05080 [Chloroflexi bacterium HGW-Chloroflexi-10]